MMNVQLHVCSFCGRELTTKSGLSRHIKYCIMNPNRKVYQSHKLSKETKEKISQKMKIAHSEGRHKGWANTRKNVNGMSYPELWFSSVIKNNFNDKDFEYNLPVGHYKLDFAWPKKMRYIEIDGKQHELQKDYDKKRDDWLKSNGWTCLRLSWSFIQTEKENAIKMMKSFIDDSFELKLQDQFFEKKRLEKLKYDNWKAKKAALGLVDKSGKVNRTLIPTSEWEHRKDIILQSGVDISKFGYVTKLVLKTGLTKRMIEKTIKRFPSIFQDRFKKSL